jgi:hypothetical protein
VTPIKTPPSLQGVVPNVANVGKEYDCWPWTGINEPCYAHFDMGQGRGIVQATFSNSPPLTKHPTCNPEPPLVYCVVQEEAIPAWEGYVIGFRINGPNIRNVEIT